MFTTTAETNQALENIENLQKNLLSMELQLQTQWRWLQMQQQQVIQVGRLN
jgi:hypothetical protein